MNAVARILLMVNLAFVLALSVSMVALLQQGRDDVVREQQAMRPVVEALIESGKTREILELVGGSLRHIRLKEEGGWSEQAHSPSPSSSVSPDDSHPPAWFVDWLDHPRGYSLSLTESGGRSLTLIADDSDEIAEVWDSATQLFWLFLGSALVCNLGIFWGVRAGVQPLGQILAALEQVRQGDYQTRLGHYGIPEVNAIASHFNDMATELERAEQANRHLTRTLMQVQEQERAALARELHDDLGQQVTGIRAQGYLIPYQQQQPEQLAHISEQIVAASDAIDQGFRRIIHNLYPVQLEQVGLRASLTDMLSELEVRTGIVCHLQDDGQEWPPWSLEAATHIYRLLQEALNNAVRHSGADRIRVDLLNTSDGYRLTITDNGQGLVSDSQSGFGIRSMQERCYALGGSLVLDNHQDGGMTVQVNLPRLPVMGGTVVEHTLGV